MKEHFTRRRVTAVAILLAILIWWLWPDGRLARVQALQNELFTAGQNLTSEQRQEKFRQLRAETSKLSPKQREQLAADGQRRMEDRMNRYFSMTAQEKARHLDEQINRDEERRRQMQANNRGPGTGSGGGQGPPGGGFGGSGPPGGGPGGGPNGPPATPEDRERRRMQRLDATSPEFRAQMDQYRKDMAQRRQQRGLSTSPAGGPRPRG